MLSKLQRNWSRQESVCLSSKDKVATISSLCRKSVVTEVLDGRREDALILIKADKLNISFNRSIETISHVYNKIESNRDKCTRMFTL